MAHNVLSGTLNPTQSINPHTCACSFMTQFVVRCAVTTCTWRRARAGDRVDGRRVSERLRVGRRRRPGDVPGDAPLRRAAAPARRRQRLSQRARTAARLRAGRVRCDQPGRVVLLGAAVPPAARRQDLHARLRRHHRRRRGSRRPALIHVAVTRRSAWGAGTTVQRTPHNC